MLKYALGIDISHKEFHACISVIDESQAVKIKSTSRFSNSPDGFKKLDEWVKKHSPEKNTPLVILMEATGVYYEGCALFLHKAGYYVSVILPNKAKKYMQAIGLKTKNDKIDAKGLARMAAEQSLERWQPMSEFFFTLRAYTRQHQSLQELKTSLNNQLHAAELTMYTVKKVNKQLKDLVKKVEKEIVTLEEAIEQHLETDVVINEKVQKLCSVKGVGLLTVAVLLAETNGFALFEKISQLISYSGYDIIENQSGNRTGKTRISKKGNSRIRRVMHMPALNLVRYKVPGFIELFERTYQRHHIKMKSYVAIQKKLLLILYTLWKKNESFRPITFQRTNAEAEQDAFLSVDFEEVKKSSPTKSKATLGKQTREVSQSASSR